MNEDGPRMFNWGGQVLGTLERLGAPKGGASIRWGAKSPVRGFYASYTFNAEFSNGEARLDIELLLEGGKWRLVGTKFNSPLLAARMSPKGEPLLE